MEKWSLAISGGFQRNSLKSSKKVYSKYQEFNEYSFKQDCIELLKESENKKYAKDEFLPEAKICMVTESVLFKKTRIKNMFREEQTKESYSGWRFIGVSDSDKYLQDKDNWVNVNFNKMIEIEPMVKELYDLPEGTVLEMKLENNNKYIIDVNTIKIIS